MRKTSSQKGVALLLVIGFSMVIFMSIIALLFTLRANLRNLASFKERTEAYYLCETGASVVLILISNGKIGTGPGQTMQDTFDYKMGGKLYYISYKVKKANGQWDIISSVGPSSGFSYTYKLHVCGRRAFPWFIRGWPGGA
jgi:hypothetical protein